MYVLVLPSHYLWSFFSLVRHVCRPSNGFILNPEVVWHTIPFRLKEMLYGYKLEMRVLKSERAILQKNRSGNSLPRHFLSPCFKQITLPSHHPRQRHRMLKIPLIPWLQSPLPLLKPIMLLLYYLQYRHSLAFKAIQTV